MSDIFESIVNELVPVGTKIGYFIESTTMVFSGLIAALHGENLTMVQNIRWFLGYCKNKNQICICFLFNYLVNDKYN
ncbi:hypothetical protein LBMAG26_08820 [Bacteroidota bacterium]|nr:hypothetical protein LBMAG26_08820 [Bacteroidota bacterium]